MSGTKTRNLYAPGKLFLFGEWAVLEGATALLVEAPAGQQGSLRASEPNASRPRSFTYRAPALFSQPRRWSWRDGTWEGASKSEFDLVGETLNAAAPEFGVPLYDLELEVSAESLFVEHTSGQRLKLGFGSSGSVCALVASALCAATTSTLEEDPARVVSVALRGHRRAQRGKGSGADVAVSVYGGLLQYRLEEPPGLGAWAVRELKPQIATCSPREDLEVKAVWTGREADTRALLSGVRRYEERDPRGYGAAIRRVGDSAASAIAAWKHGAPGLVLDAVRAADDSLLALGLAAGVEIIVPEHETIAALVKEHVGAHAAVKSSGAGGGDMTLLFAQRGKLSNALFATLRAKGFVVFDLPSISHASVMV